MAHLLTTPRITPGVIAARRRLETARTVALLAIIVYGAIGMLTEWWPIDWLDLVQQRLFGAYSPKMSAILFILFAMIGVTWLLNRLTHVAEQRAVDSGEASGQAIAAPPTPMPSMSQSRMLLRMGVATVVTIWVAGVATFAWFDTQQRRDNQADYLPLPTELVAPAGLDTGDHVSVRGVVLAGGAVAYRSDSNSTTPSYYLIPVVPEGWKPGNAAHVVLQVHAPSELPDYRPSAPHRSWLLSEAVLGRVLGSTPLIARTEFDSMGVPLAADARLLEVVASIDGKPVQQHVDYLERVLWIAGVGSAAMSLVFVAAFFTVRRRERNAAAPSGGAR